MPISEAELQEAEARFSQLSPALGVAFRKSYAGLPAGTTEDQARLWLEAGLDLASHSVRSWEASADYLHAAADVIGLLDAAGYRAWVDGGRSLVDLASVIGAAYFRASPAVVPMLAGPQVSEWA